MGICRQLQAKDSTGHRLLKTGNNVHSSAFRDSEALKQYRGAFKAWEPEVNLLSSDMFNVSFFKPETLFR